MLVFWKNPESIPDVGEDTSYVEPDPTPLKHGTDQSPVRVATAESLGGSWAWPPSFGHTSFSAFLHYPPFPPAGLDQ